MARSGPRQGHAAYMIPGTVREVSATFVARTTRRWGDKIRCCSASERRHRAGLRRRRAARSAAPARRRPAGGLGGVADIAFAGQEPRCSGFPARSSSGAPRIPFDLVHGVSPGSAAPPSMPRPEPPSSPPSDGVTIPQVGTGPRPGRVRPSFSITGYRDQSGSGCCESMSGRKVDHQQVRALLRSLCR